MKRLVVDLDGTLTVDEPSVEYASKQPNRLVIQKLKDYKAAGFQIVIFTARNMSTHNNNVGLINAFTLPVVLNWLDKHDVPYDEVYIGKPWCGTDGFYIDDKAVRPSEFVALDYKSVLELLAREGEVDSGP